MKTELKGLVCALLTVTALCTHAMAGEFTFKFEIKGKPETAATAGDIFDGGCVAEASKIKNKLDGAFQLAGVQVTNSQSYLSAEKDATRRKPYVTCELVVKGVADKDVRLVDLVEREDHLGKFMNGDFTKKNFSISCDADAKALALNPFEVRQVRTAKRRAFHGLECTVTSSVLVVR